MNEGRKKGRRKDLRGSVAIENELDLNPGEAKGPGPLANHFEYGKRSDVPYRSS